jgi:2-keto-3-deoxy-L-arabinonate dehydratase
MVAPPREPEWSRQQFRNHFRTVAAASDCELMVQDAPFAIGVELGVELVLELAAEIDTITAYKIEALPYWENAVRAGEVAGDRLAVFGGHGGVYLMDVLDAGSVGLIPGADVTATLVRAWNAGRAGDRVMAAQEYQRVLPLLVFQAQSMGLLIGGAKTLLQAHGVIDGTVSRHPDANLTATTRQRMLYLAREVGELPEA